jgi:uncharacterized membrane protein SirB2
VTLAAFLKLIHVSCAFASIVGFALRGYWMAVDNPLLQHRVAKVLPHIIDTLLLGSALTLLFVLHLSPLAQPWLSAKIIALLLYIGLGMVALRFGRSKKIKVSACLLALLSAGYMISVAYTKSPLGILSLLHL